jgi:CspA family cold shock protein
MLRKGKQPKAKKSVAVALMLDVQGTGSWTGASRLIYPPDSERSETMPNGTVKFFNTAKGFGFIELDEGGKDVFVHASALEAAGIRMLKEGDRVSFVLEDDRRGRGKQAGQLKKI